MPRLAARVDASQPMIVAALRKIGCSVLLLHRVGRGCPDLLVWVPYSGRSSSRYLLIEIKEPDKGPNDEQREFMSSWPGEIHIVHNVPEALEAVLGKEMLR